MPSTEFKVMKSSKISKISARIPSGIKKFWKEEDGQDLIEYALLVALVGLVIVVVAGPLRTAIENIFTRITTALDSAPGA